MGRKITSFVMLYSFVIMVLSGIMLFISPFGRLAMMIKWQVFYLDKMQWQALHLIFMVIFTISGLLHILYNIKAIKHYMKNKAKKIVVITLPHLIAIIIIIPLFYLTINHIEPLESFVKLNKNFNTYWIKKFKEEHNIK